MFILVTGADTVVGRAVARLLTARGVPHELTSPVTSPRDLLGRVDNGHSKTRRITQLCLVPDPDDLDPMATAAPVLAIAQEHRTPRAVVVSSAAIRPASPGIGLLHSWIAAHWPEWVILRPARLMQSLTIGHHADTIRTQGAIFTATSGGRAAFIDADDVARAAVEAILRPRVINSDLLLTGPAPLSYDEVARISTVSAGRLVQHRPLDAERLFLSLVEDHHLDGDIATALVADDLAAARGRQDRVSPLVETITGVPPTSFEQFSAMNASAWDVPRSSLAGAWAVSKR